jgi:hypothetical protein
MSGAFTELPFSTESGSSPIRPDFIPSSIAFFLATFETTTAPVTTNVAGISSDELLELWKSVTDPGYHRPILEKPDGGRAFIEASHAIHSVGSASIGASTQSLYLRPWSGQTAEPSHVQQLATGFLELSREPTPFFPAWIPVVFAADQFFVDHVGIDWSPDGPSEFLSGRRYYVSQTLAIGSGQLGPLLLPARAESTGASYNLPGPGTIRGLTQIGSGLTNTALSTSAPARGINLLTLGAQPDVLSSLQVGQYIRLSSPGGVAGQVRRLIGYTPPVDASNGGVAALDAVGIFRAGSLVGSWRVGEEILQASTGAVGRVVTFGENFAVEAVSGGAFGTGAVVGSYSGATATFLQVVRLCELPAASSVVWTVLDWTLDAGLTATNPESFTGGRLPVLEELGEERGLPRSVAEPEVSYRARVLAADDVVSPNALRRTANRVLAPYGAAGCLREVGSAKLPGLFCDVPPDGNPAHAFAYDMDPTVRIGDRWKVALSFADSRAFFLMGIPPLGLGDFSLYFDESFYDVGSDFLDGYAATDASLASAVYAGLLRAKLGGVGFAMYQETNGCV